jgi:hypothetical protein
LALVVTLYCIKLLLDVRESLGGRLSYSEIGFLAYGSVGKVMVDFSLFAS